MQVEQEEEYLTNTLQKRLNQVTFISAEQEQFGTHHHPFFLKQLQKEKVDLENALEQEQEYIVNKLQKQLDSLRAQQPIKSPSLRSIQDAPVSPAATASPSLRYKSLYIWPLHRITHR